MYLILNQEENPDSGPYINGTLAYNGPPDSHEAMNNRELKPIPKPAKVGDGREKRSYEFLMGLVNNNSKQRVIDVDGDDKIPEYKVTKICVRMRPGVVHKMSETLVAYGYTSSPSSSFRTLICDELLHIFLRSYSNASLVFASSVILFHDSRSRIFPLQL